MNQEQDIFCIKLLLLTTILLFVIFNIRYIINCNLNFSLIQSQDTGNIYRLLTRKHSRINFCVSKTAITTGTDSLHQAIRVQKLLRSGDIDIDDVISKLINAYGCNNQEKMSLAYKEIIADEANNILSGIKNGNFTNEVSLSDAIGKFSRGKKTPMTSLRDTEEQIEIKI